MTDVRPTLERARANFAPPPMPMEDVLRLRDRRQRNRRIRAGAVGILVALAMVLGGLSMLRSTQRPATPSPSPSGVGIFKGLGGWIVYADYSDPNGLLAVDPADGRIVQVSGLVNAWPEAWTPDGTRLLVLTGRLTHLAWKGRALSFLNPDGSLTPVVPAKAHTDLWDASISPDGKTVLYVESRRGGNGSRIDVIGVEGGTPTTLTHGGFVYNPAFSPDGSQVAYMEWIKGFDHLALMNADGTDQRPLGKTGLAPEAGMSWAPGPFLAFAASDGIHIVDPGHGMWDPAFAPSPGPIPVIDGRDIWDPMWSPGGTHVEYVASWGRNPVSHAAHLKIADADGTHVRTYDAYEGPWNPLPRTRSAIGTTNGGTQGSAFPYGVVALALAVIGIAVLVRREVGLRRDAR